MLCTLCLSLCPPSDQWYMDTKATSHMTTNTGILFSYFNLRNTQQITISNGHSIHIHGSCNTFLPNLFLPFSVNNVLHAPLLIKNLICINSLLLILFLSNLTLLVFLLRIF